MGQYLNGEERRVYSYLKLSSSESYLTMIADILIKDHYDYVYGKVENMLNVADYLSILTNKFLQIVWLD